MEPTAHLNKRMVLLAGFLCFATGIGWMATGNLPAGIAFAAAGFTLLLAAQDPVKHWPASASGLLLCLSIPWLAVAGGWPLMMAIPAGLAALIIAASLVPVLQRAYTQSRAFESVVRIATVGSLREGLEGHRTATGLPLNGLIDQTPALLVFLRHTGCTFCRQTLADLAAASTGLAERGVQVVLVHHSSDESLHTLLQRYQLRDVHVVHDAHRALYRHFGLERGSAWRVAAHPLVLLRSAWSVFAERHGMTRPDGDPWQMPGAFALFRGRILSGYFHGYASDRPDYLQLCADVKLSASPAKTMASNERDRNRY